MVGWRSISAAIGTRSHIMTIIASTMAAAMISTWSGRASPTAVNTESSENTISISAIWITTTRRVPALARPGRSGAAPSSVSWISVTLLSQQEQAAGAEDQVADREGAPEAVNSGAVSRVSHTIENSSARRVSMRQRQADDARARAGARAAARPTRIDRKITLSMPSTISSSASVANASALSG